MNFLFSFKNQQKNTFMTQSGKQISSMLAITDFTLSNLVFHTNQNDFE